MFAAFSVLSLSVSSASALLTINKVHDSSCVAEDSQNRAQFQNKLAAICEDMCKEVGAYPKCAQCPQFVAPDATPGVMTWTELLEHMDNLVAWGNDSLKGWRKQASALQKGQHPKLAAVEVTGSMTEKACSAADLSNRAKIQNKMAAICEDMCKEVGAYPKCAQCPAFVAPDATPGVMTWTELLEHMDNLVAWGNDSLKGWRKQASALVEVKGQSCSAADLQHRVQFQNKLSAICEDMCKEVGAYPKCAQCPQFVAPDATPGVMTWTELLEHMDNLVAWGNDSLKGWRKQASALQKDKHPKLAAVEVTGSMTEKACSAADVSNRAQIQNKMAAICEDMCKEVGAYPKCAQCPAFVAPDATPGVMTWTELLEHMDNLVAWGNDSLKGWRKQASALVEVKGQSCSAADLQHRVQFQNKLSAICEDMCKEVGAYPKCAQCPQFVAPDATPGVMTWTELLEHMDNLVAWGNDSLKGWRKQASALQKGQHPKLAAVEVTGSMTEKACSAADVSNRAQLQNKMAAICEDMCKEVGAYPKCAQCPAFVAPDATPGVMTWTELLEHMDNLVAWGNDSLKGWRKQASALQISAH